MAFFSGNKQFQSRHMHIARDDITAMKLVYPNYYVPPSPAARVELNTGAVASINAGIEVNGAAFRVPFGGLDTGTIPIGDIPESDWGSGFGTIARARRSSPALSRRTRAA